MKRNLEPVDLVVAVGVLATVICGYVMFMASSGGLNASGPEAVTEERVHTVIDAMQWVQPALGQAIVDEAILERNMASELTREGRLLNRVFMTDQWLRVVPVGFSDRVRTYARAVEGDHASSMQGVMGHVIANGTLRGVRSGVLSPEQLDGNFNRALVGQAVLLGAQMDEAFRMNWQERLGRLIVTSSQDYLKLQEQNQERIGRSIVDMAEIQDSYRTKQGAVQEQLASAAVAAVHGEQIADRFTHSGVGDYDTMSESFPVERSHSLPDIPAGMLLMASLALIGIFVAGLVTPVPRSRPGIQGSDYQAEGERYRKTA